MIDTYWSDHCRHTTFLTELTDVQFEDADVESGLRAAIWTMRRDQSARTKPVTLMDHGDHRREAT